MMLIKVIIVNGYFIYLYSDCSVVGDMFFEIKYSILIFFFILDV